MSFIGSYKPRQFNLSGLKGISDQTLEMHFKLYEGYVKESNKLSEKISEFIKDGNVDQDEMPAYSELSRRLGFEFNGMVLHEYYFENLTSGGVVVMSADSQCAVLRTIRDRPHRTRTRPLADGR